MKEKEVSYSFRGEFLIPMDDDYSVHIPYSGTQIREVGTFLSMWYKANSKYREVCLKNDNSRHFLYQEIQTLGMVLSVMGINLETYFNDNHE